MSPRQQPQMGKDQPVAETEHPPSLQPRAFLWRRRHRGLRGSRRIVSRGYSTGGRPARRVAFGCRYKRQTGVRFFFAIVVVVAIAVECRDSSHGSVHLFPRAQTQAPVDFVSGSSRSPEKGKEAMPAAQNSQTNGDGNENESDNDDDDDTDSFSI